MWSEWRDERNKEGEEIAQEEAHEGTKDTQDDRFEEELEHNVATRCTNGFSDTNFASALRNRYEHDVHNADAAYDKGDGGD